MAKTSSSKKVAKVARAGSGKRRVRERPKLGFPLLIFAILVVGSLTVFYARTSRFDSAAAAEAPVANQDHWHNAYGFYVCDHFLPPFTDQGADTEGIHTHGDGIIHIHPFVAASAGANAQLKVFAKDVGMTLGSDSITTPDGTEYKNGYDCNGKPAKVLVYRWDQAEDPTVPANVYDHDFGNIVLKNDRAAITFAVVPDGTDVPRPDSVSTLDNLSDVGTSNGASPTGVPDAGATGTPTPSDSVPATPTPSDSTPAAGASGAPGAPTPTISIPTDAGGATPSSAPAAAPTPTPAPAPSTP
jgi:hypothetical protein